MKNKYDEINEKALEKLVKMNPEFMKMPYHSLLKFAVEILNKSEPEPYPHYEGMYKALREVMGNPTLDTSAIFTLTFANVTERKAPSGIVRNMDLKIYLRSSWVDVEKVTILHPTKNVLSLDATKMDFCGNWFFYDDNTFGVCEPNRSIVYLVFANFEKKKKYY